MPINTDSNAAVTSQPPILPERESASTEAVEARSCPECRTQVELTTTRSETFCESCGLVVEEDRLDHGPEWHAFTHDEHRARSRVGSPVTETRHDRGISAEIGDDVDANGHRLSRAKRRQFGRLRKWNSQAKYPDKRSSNLAYGFDEIRRIVAALELSQSVREEASKLFREAQDEALLQGRSLESISAASVYAVCRLRRLPRRLEEVAEVARVSHQRVDGAYKTLNLELGLTVPPPLPKDFLPRILSAIDASDTVGQRADELLSLPAVQGLANGRKPSSLAAGCVYAAARDLEGRGAHTQTDIAEAAGITEASLRTRWEEIRELDLGGVQIR